MRPFSTPVHVWADRVTSLKMTGITIPSFLHRCHSSDEKAQEMGEKTHARLRCDLR